MPQDKKVCIVGFAPQTRDLANAQPEDFEIWGMNINHIFLKRYDRWFQMHPFDSAGRPFYGRDSEHYEFLKTCQAPVYMNDPTDEIPNAVRYPYDFVRRALGREYITSTTAHALALAIAEEYSEIRIVGVNMTTELEYVEQRPCLEWMLGLAEGRGIRVWIPDESPILKGVTYPSRGRRETDLIQARLDYERVAYMETWGKLREVLGAYKLAKEAGLEVRGLKKQYAEHALRLQRDLGKYDASLHYMRHLGGTDRGHTEMPSSDIPVELMDDPEALEVVNV